MMNNREKAAQKTETNGLNICPKWDPMMFSQGLKLQKFGPKTHFDAGHTGRMNSGHTDEWIAVGSASNKFSSPAVSQRSYICQLVLNVSPMSASVCVRACVCERERKREREEKIYHLTLSGSPIKRVIAVPLFCIHSKCLMLLQLKLLWWLYSFRARLNVRQWERERGGERVSERENEEREKGSRLTWEKECAYKNKWVCEGSDNVGRNEKEREREREWVREREKEREEKGGTFRDQFEALVARKYWRNVALIN